MSDSDEDYCNQNLCEEYIYDENAYVEIEIYATSPETVIWVCDDEGYFVIKGQGSIKTGLLPGNFLVEFGLGNTEYPIVLKEDSVYTQAEFESKFSL